MKSLKEVQIYSYFDYGVEANQDAYYGEEVGLTFALLIAFLTGQIT